MTVIITATNRDPSHSWSPTDPELIAFDEAVWGARRACGVHMQARAGRRRAATAGAGHVRQDGGGYDPPGTT
jgi:hypothetical protein